jgi:Zn-dependent M28 family amino/carboxypeptidase
VSVPVVSVRRERWPAEASSARLVVRSRRDAPVAGVNVVGRAAGGEGAPLLVLAHYDHLGAFTDLSDSTRVVYRGANDNASGTALLLGLAQAAAQDSLGRDVIFAAVGGEEQGLIGAFALQETLAGEPLAAVLNFDMVASGEDGLLAFGGSDHPDLFARAERLADSLGVGPLTPRASRANSDHYPFLAAGTPGLYLLTAGGTQPYHSPADLPETLEWDDFAAVYRLALALMRDLAGAPE